MPEMKFRAAVQANFLLAASAFCGDREAYAGVLIEQHSVFQGMLLQATTGSQMALIYDGRAAIEGYPQSWKISHQWLSTQMDKLENSKAVYDPDNLFAVLTWTGMNGGSIDLVEARSGALALEGNGCKIKTILKDRDDLIVGGELPSMLDTIDGLKAVDRSLAPSNWVYPAGLSRVEQLAHALTRGTNHDFPAIMLLRTKRNSVVQVAFRDHDEAAVFLVTLKDEGEAKPVNPGWLDVLL